MNECSQAFDASGISVVVAEEDMTNELTQVINWAYRGKENTSPWTTESHLLEGERITTTAMKNLISTQDPKKSQIFAAVALRSDGKQRTILGSIHAEYREDNRAEFGLFAVDPSVQSAGIGRMLLNRAESHAIKNWGTKEAVMYLLDVREDLYRGTSVADTYGQGSRFHFQWLQTLETQKSSLDSMN